MIERSAMADTDASIVADPHVLFEHQKFLVHEQIVFCHGPFARPRGIIEIQDNRSGLALVGSHEEPRFELRGAPRCALTQPGNDLQSCRLGLEKGREPRDHKGFRALCQWPFRTLHLWERYGYNPHQLIDKEHIHSSMQSPKGGSN